MLNRICSIAGKPVQSSTVDNVIMEFSMRLRGKEKEAPIVNRHMNSYHGQSIVIDVVFHEFPDDQPHPALIMVCDLAKFVRAKFLKSGKPESYVDIVIAAWVPLFGYPQTIIWDNATAYGGPVWEALCNIRDIQMRIGPTKAAFQVGQAERYVALIKQGFQAIRRFHQSEMTRGELLAIACASENSTPLNGQDTAAIALVTGGNALVGRLAPIGHKQT